MAVTPNIKRRKIIKRHGGEKRGNGISEENNG